MRHFAEGSFPIHRAQKCTTFALRRRSDRQVARCAGSEPHDFLCSNRIAIAKSRSPQGDTQCLGILRALLQQSNSLSSACGPQKDLTPLFLWCARAVFGFFNVNFPLFAYKSPQSIHKFVIPSSCGASIYWRAFFIRLYLERPGRFRRGIVDIPFLPQE